MKLLRFFLFLFAALALGAPATAATYAIRNVRIVPVSGPVLERGTLVLKDGRIAACGARVSVPREAKVIDGKGLTAYPGMIETRTRLGLSEIPSVRATQDGVELGDFNPHLRAAHSFNVHSELIPVTRANGITTVLSCPGGGVIGGQCALMNLSGWTREDAAVKPAAALMVRFPGPSNQAGQNQQLDALKKMLKDAAAYRPTAAEKADLRLEALQPYVRGELPVIFEANSEAEIRGAVALAEEFKLKYLLSGVDEAQKVVSLLKEKKVRCLVGPILAQPNRAADAYDLLYSTPAILYRAGVRVAIISGETANARNLPYHAAMAAAYGLPAEEALRAITLTPAEFLGVEKDLGSLEVGKLGNLFLADGDPMDARTQIKVLFINGEPVDLDNRHDRLYRKFLERIEVK